MKPLAKTITHALLALGLAGTAVTPALASETHRMSVKVPTADLDLGTAEGQRKLDSRIAKAVRSVCRANNPSTGTRMMSHDAIACLAKARIDAKRQVAALVTEEQRGG